MVEFGGQGSRRAWVVQWLAQPQARPPEGHPGISEPEREIKAIDYDAVLLAEIKGRNIVRVIPADLGTDHEHVTELVAQGDRVARVVGREARPFTLLVSPPLIADDEVIPVGELERRVIEDPVGLRKARNELAESPSATKPMYRTETRRSAHYGVDLPHVIRLRLRVDLFAEPVLISAHDVIEVIVPGLLTGDLEVAELGIVDVVQARVERVVVILGYPATAEETGRSGARIPGGHVGTCCNGALKHQSLGHLEREHHTRLGVGVEREKQRVASHVIVRCVLRFDVRASDPAATSKHKSLPDLRDIDLEVLFDRIV